VGFLRLGELTTARYPVPAEQPVGGTPDPRGTPLPLQDILYGRRRKLFGVLRPVPSAFSHTGIAGRAGLGTVKRRFPLRHSHPFQKGPISMGPTSSGEWRGAGSPPGYEILLDAWRGHNWLQAEDRSRHLR
jgi:hypothetical protein